MIGFNSLVDPMLTDLYQLTMAYGYWKTGTHGKKAVFDLFFRRCPFGGEFAIFAGLEQVLRYVETFRFRDEHIAYLKSLPEFTNRESAFFEWLSTLDCSQLKIAAPAEGTVMFPRVPLLRVEGPLAVAQLVETTLLSLVNYASLVATNAARYRLASGWDKTLLEFGLRRAQGPDGGMSASYYSYMGGFDASSNVKAGELFGIPIAGTHAHAFVESFTSLADVRETELIDARGNRRDFMATVMRYNEMLGYGSTNRGELAAFIAYGMAFPERFTALVDTYNTLESGIPNFLSVAAALSEFGYIPQGIRLDSGDLAYLSKQAKVLFERAEQITAWPLARCRVTASNDLNEEILWSLQKQNHGIDNFGIGTNLVTCEGQPAFGGVYKLVEIEDSPRIKLSENVIKITIPGKKQAYRLSGKEGFGLVDLLVGDEEPQPQPRSPVLCRDPFDATKKVNVLAEDIVLLSPVVWDGKRLANPVPLTSSREWVLRQLKNTVRPDYMRRDNPAKYKVAVSESLFRTLHRLIEQESVVKTLR